MDLTSTLQIVNITITCFSIVVIPLASLICQSHLFRDIKRSKCCGGTEMEFNEAIEVVKKTISNKNLNGMVDIKIDH
jgi:hypothetical protein